MTVSTDDRSRLQSRDLFKPNTRYEGKVLPDGQIILVELVPRSGPVRFKSKTAALAALNKSPLRFKGNWERLREDTR